MAAALALGAAALALGGGADDDDDDDDDGVNDSAAARPFAADALRSAAALAVSRALKHALAAGTRALQLASCAALAAIAKQPASFGSAQDGASSFDVAAAGLTGSSVRSMTSLGELRDMPPMLGVRLEGCKARRVEGLHR